MSTQALIDVYYHCSCYVTVLNSLNTPSIRTGTNWDCLMKTGLLLGYQFSEGWIQINMRKNPLMTDLYTVTNCHHMLHVLSSKLEEDLPPHHWDYLCCLSPQWHHLLHPWSHDHQLTLWSDSAFWLLSHLV